MPIPLDSFTITFLARELDRLLRRQEIRSAGIGEDRVIEFAFANEGIGTLRMLYDSAFPLLFVAPRTRTKASYERAPRFEEPLATCTVVKIEQMGLERVIRLSAEGPPGHFRLYFELTPPLPNLFLADSEDKVLAILLRAGTQTRRRTIKQGELYSLPAAPLKLNPFDITADEFDPIPWQHDEEALARFILGISPFMSREIVARARRYGSLVRAFREIMELYKTRQATPTLFQATAALSRRPPAIGIAWYQPSVPGVTDAREVESLSAAAATAFHAFLKATALDRRRSALLATIAKDVARWQTLEEDAKHALAAGEEASRLRIYGEMILANRSKVKKGAAEVRLPDIYSEKAGEKTVPLDRRLSPQGNAEAYFKRARKAERSAALAQDTIKNAERHLASLRKIQAEAESPDISLARLKEIAADLGGASGPRRERPQETDARATTLGIRPRKYVVSGGWAVLVGRSAAENDILTHKYASPSDLWFHARQSQGSHVVLRRDKKRTQPSKDAIIEAARLAAYFSKAKTSKHVPVSYTEKRYVKKVRRGAPGLAVMLREKVVFVTPTPPMEPQAR